MSRTVIKLRAGVRGFAEDKDEAKMVRVDTILPSLAAKNRVVLDFGNVKFCTQSYIHALIGEALQRFKDEALARIEFRHCAPQVKSLVELVVDYSLGGFRTDQGEKPAEPLRAAGSKRRIA
jgi:hypothetical protein